MIEMDLSDVKVVGLLGAEGQNLQDSHLIAHSFGCDKMEGGMVMYKHIKDFDESQRP